MSGGRFGGNPVKSPVGELYVTPGAVYGGGTGPTMRLAPGCSLSRGGTGSYTILPSVNFPFVMGPAPTVVSATNNYCVQVSSYYNGMTTGFTGHVAGATAYVTFQVTGQTNGTAVDLASGEELWFELAFIRTVRP